ncbi:facilitated trehalose transporter Tret1-like isoform X2 [Cylas formicarius]|uniref:facilitated trehalose transporter Tret1-like isoform X2 n=1 Tax=Cylas formicarius TaxID=197179 RepID=UPI002958CD67|nr:facilitated trehalose transporter Tret1-like isoform X2 [Cylas formicarius]
MLPDLNRYTALAAFCAHSFAISIGVCQGYSAIWIPQLESSGEFDTTTDQNSWLASLGAVTNPVGSVLSGVLAEYLGRKRSIQISTVPFIVGWLLIGLGPNITWLYVGRAITGVAAGMSTACYTYVGEIATPSNRGLLNALGPMCASFGILLTYILGYLIHWSTVALISVSFAVVTLITMQLVPESPPHLLKTQGPGTGDDSETYRAFYFFRRSVADTEHEIKVAMANMTHSDDEPHKSLVEVYFSPETVKPFIYLVVLFLLQELSGIYTILYYAVSFFGETDLEIDDYVSSIIVGTIRFIMSIACVFLVNRFGRKVLCTFSSLGMALSVLVVGLYQKYYEINPDSDRILSLLPLFCIMFNVFFSMIGMLPVPWILCGEMFPLRVRPVMAGLVICMAQGFIFVCVKVYNDMVRYLEFSGTLFTFFVASVASMLFCMYALPETKNKSLHEIEAYFRGDKAAKEKRPEKSGIHNAAFTQSSENITVVTR